MRIMILGTVQIFSNSYDVDLLAQTKEDFFMLYNVVVNDWGETTYVPTALGNGLLAAMIDRKSVV